MKEYTRRIIKSSVAVFITMMLYVLLLCIDKLCGINHKEWLSFSNMYTPFFGSIAAIYVINKYAKDSIKSAKRRGIGTIIGGLFGMVLILLVEFIFLDLINLDTSNINELIIWKIIEFIIVSLAFIPLSMLIKKLKLDDALFITGLTYFSVTISIRNGGMPVVQFAFNRIISTLIGVGIALLVTHFSIFRHKNKDITFVCSFENMNIENDYSFNEEEIYLTNYLYHLNVDLVFVTSMTVGELGKIFNEIEYDGSVIIMEGAVTYNRKNKEYVNVKNIDKDEVNIIKGVVLNYTDNIFTYSLVNKELTCYYRSIKNKGEKHYFKHNKENEYFRFTYGDIPDKLDVCHMEVVLESKKIDAIYLELTKLELKGVNIAIHDYLVDGYKIIKIYNKSATKYNGYKKLKTKSNGKLVVVGNSKSDLELMKKADIAICYKDAEKEVIECADIVLNSNLLTDSLRQIKKIYHSRKI